MNTEKGIVIVVTGHSYYGRFAYNLCVTIKAAEKDFPVCVLYNGGALAHLSAQQLDLFDYIIAIDESIKPNTMCKLYATEYTPFEKSLVCDADTLWLERTPSELFSEVKDQHFASITEGRESDVNRSYFFWADPGEIKQKYQLKTEIHQWRSEVMYFDQEGAEVLRRALQICQNHGLDSVSNFGHAVPDELGINIATAEMGVLPHKYKWQPSYWPNMTGGIVKWGKDLNDHHYLISFGSNTASGSLKKVYGQITGAAFNKLGKQNVFPLIEKKSFLPQVRNKM